MTYHSWTSDSNIGEDDARDAEVNDSDGRSRASFLKAVSLARNAEDFRISSMYRVSKRYYLTKILSH